MTLDTIVNEIYTILQNDSGLYHGWYTFTVTKYGSHVAYAIMNPAADDPYEWCRTPSNRHYGETLNEAAQGLLDELREWVIKGKPYRTIVNGHKLPDRIGEPCSLCNGTGKKK